MRDKILVLDDEANLRMILEATLTRGGYDVLSFESFESAKTTLDTEEIAVVLTDLQMPNFSGMEVLNYCQQFAPDVPVIMITAFGTVERAVLALKSGAFDFVLKPFESGELFRTIEKACQSRRIRKREPALEIMSAVGVGPVPVPLFGQCASTRTLRDDVERISRLESPLLILGEVGTGKRSIAYEIHRKSDRARHPFVQISCNTIPPIFQITELMGVEKGASPVNLFSKPGSFELAQGGTLFIEEIDTLSIDAQNAMFTALENESFTRVGGVRKFPLDFRIIATSSRNISDAVKKGSFHVELFYKLSADVLDLKSLRDRTEDIRSDLVPYFLSRACQKKGVPTLECSEEVMTWFQNQEWKGNLGELERKVQKGVNLAKGSTLKIEDLMDP